MSVITPHVYGDGWTEYSTEDGLWWTPAKSGRELADLGSEHLVYVTGFGVRPKSYFETLVIAGAPFLPAIAHLVPVYVQVSRAQVDAECGEYRADPAAYRAARGFA